MAQKPHPTNDPTHKHYIGPKLKAGDKLNDPQAGARSMALVQSNVVDFNILSVWGDGDKQYAVVEQDYKGGN